MTRSKRNAQLDRIVGQIMTAHEDFVGYVQDLDEIGYHADAESLRDIITMIEDWRCCIRS